MMAGHNYPICSKATIFKFTGTFEYSIDVNILESILFCHTHKIKLLLLLISNSHKKMFVP